MNRTSNEKELAELKEVYRREGARAALVYLNSLTKQRFTSLYRFDRETLRNVTFYDREQPDVTSCEAIPVMASYCVFVRDSGARFAVENASCDSRVEGHPKQLTVQSYCGVPLLNDDGKMFGTICHFDFKPGRVEDLDVALMEAMARLLNRE